MSLTLNAEEIFKKVQSSPWAFAIFQIEAALTQAGFLCWISGGAVRDFILGLSPSDIDLTTNAPEEDILELFPQALLVGQKFGVYKIPFKAAEKSEWPSTPFVIDLTLFREEDGYEDGRRPKTIKPCEPKYDALRRDFTINALFYDLKNKALIDYVEGVLALQKGQLITVGVPAVRFNEDHLRLLRLMRFQHQLKFSIEEKTLQAAFNQANLINSVSSERLLAELKKAVLYEPRIQFWCNTLTRTLLAALKTPFEYVDETKLLENLTAKTHWNSLKAEEHFEKIKLDLSLYLASDVLQKVSQYRQNLALVKDLFFLQKSSVGDLSEQSFLKALNFLRFLKVSRQEINFFQQFRKSFQEFSQFSLSEFELALQIEKKLQKNDFLGLLIFFELVLNEVIAFTKFEQALICVKKAEASLLSGEEVQKELLQQKTITVTQALDELRLLQFEGKMSSKAEAIAYLKVKYVEG